MLKRAIAITGGRGLLGSTLMKVLAEKGYSVYPIEGDIRDAEKILNNQFPEKIDWVIHTAAITNVNECEKDEATCRAVNVSGTKNVAALAKKLGARLIYISTVSVFSGEQGNYKENDIPHPGNIYNISKLDGEREAEKSGESLVLRINLIGIHPKGSRGQNFFEWLYDSILQNKDMNLFSDVMMNPLSNWTIAEMIARIIEKDIIIPVLHIASKNTLSKADVGKLLIEKLGNYSGNIKVTSVDSLGGAARPKQMWLNAELAQKILDTEMPTLESEIETILNHQHHD